MEICIKGIIKESWMRRQLKFFYIIHGIKCFKRKCMGTFQEDKTAIELQIIYSIIPDILNNRKVATAGFQTP